MQGTIWLLWEVGLMAHPLFLQILTQLMIGTENKCTPCFNSAMDALIINQ